MDRKAFTPLRIAVLVLPTLLLGLIARWLPFAAVLGVIVIALASDTLWSWLPW